MPLVYSHIHENILHAQRVDRAVDHCHQWTVVEFLHLNSHIMETLITENFLSHSIHGCSRSVNRFNCRGKASRSSFFLEFSHRKWRLDAKKPNFSSITVASSMNYGGWDDFKCIENDSNQSGKFVRFQNFLVSVGIDDKKHIFMFILGLVSAFAISRVRVSAVLAFPASVLVFGVGFSLGFVRGGGVGFPVKQISSRNGSKKGGENSRVSDEKLKSLVDFFNELDAKVINLQKEMKGAMDSNFIQVGEMNSYQNVIKTISLDISREKNLVEASINDMGTFGGMSVDDGEVEKRSSKRKRELGMSFIDVFGFVGGLFKEKSFGSKPNKVKDVVKKELMESLNSKGVINQIHTSPLANRVEEKTGSSPVSSNNVGNRSVGASPQEGSNNPAFKQYGAEISGDRTGKMGAIPGMKSGNDRALLHDEEYYHHSNSLKFMNNQRNFMKMNHHNDNEMKVPSDDFRDPLDTSLDMRPRETKFRSFSEEAKGSLQQEDALKISNGAVLPNSRKNGEERTYRFNLRERRGEEDDSDLGKHRIGGDMEVDPSSSSMISEDVMFNRHLTEATNLLKQARECLTGITDEEKAEVLLYKSARLLARAISMKPMSLLAVGQLGNTLLLHGELKLKISRDFRTLLLTGDSLSKEKVRRVLPKGLDDQVLNRDRMASVLVDVCEECEELLVEAGRRYKMALSIDGNDVRSLYNWGLALSYRAQLIADIGPEAAFDADKLFLAATDKFDAMLSMNNTYAPDALYRWGIALQQRSQLRPSNSKEKMRLLHQAKRLFEDALSMDTNNLQVREALSSCISELGYRDF